MDIMDKLARNMDISQRIESIKSSLRRFDELGCQDDEGIEEIKWRLPLLEGKLRELERELEEESVKENINDAYKELNRLLGD